MANRIAHLQPSYRKLFATVTNVVTFLETGRKKGTFLILTITIATLLMIKIVISHWVLTLVTF